MNSQISSNIANKIKNYEQISSLLYMDSKLRDLLTQHYQHPIDFVEAYDYINNLIYGIQLANTDLAGITIYSFNDSFPSDGLFIKHVDEQMLAMPWYQKLQQSYGNAVYSVIVNHEGKEPVITLARLLNNHNMMQPYGVLTIDVKESALYSLFEQEAKTMDIYLVNQDGVILSTRSKDQILQPFSSLIPSEQWKEGYSGTFTQPMLKADSMVVYHSLPIGWRTVSFAPLRTVLGEVYQASNRVLLISLCSLALSVFLIIMVARYFSNRFQALTRFVRRVGDEDFSFDVKLNSKDEIGVLAESFNTMKQQLDKLINEVYKKEIMRKEAELTALQSQINPHFLYNTLAIISSLSIQNKDRQVGKVVRHLSNFYKTSLSKGKPVILIQKEVEITKHYIEIQLMRFHNLFQVHWQLDEKLFRHQTVKLILQPFVENAIHHAIWDEDQPINIIIRLYRKDQSICFEVVDDGGGMTAERAADIMSANREVGYGIYNVHERIQLTYGAPYGVFIYSRPGIGTQAILTIPII